MNVQELLAHAKHAANKNNQIAIVDIEPGDGNGIDEPVAIIFGFGREKRNDIIRILNTFLDFDDEGEGVDLDG